MGFGRVRWWIGIALAVTGCSLFTNLGDLSEGEGAGTPGADAAPAEDAAPGADASGVDGGPDPEPPPGPPKWRLASETGPARHSAAIAYDENRKLMVLFGGFGTQNLRDTWEWDGVAWTQRTLPEQPSGRRRHKMVHDVARKVVLLYGGTRGATSDQWHWDGVRWREVQSANHAPTFQTTAVAYDSDRGAAVLFGGNHYPATGNAFMRDETWEWNGTDWTQRTPAKSPAVRRGHAMAYDAGRKRVVLFGGRGSGQLADTWEYDGTTWIEREPIEIPKARYGACMAYDPRRRIVVMHGGGSLSGNFDETWHWDGDNWTRGPTGAPAVRSCAMAWDPARRSIVMFGGTLAGDVASGQTWVYE